MHCTSKAIFLVVLLICFLGVSVWAQALSAPAVSTATPLVSVVPTVVEKPEPIIEDTINLVNLHSADIKKALENDSIVSKLIEVTDSQILVRGTADEVNYAKRKISWLDHPQGIEIVRLTNVQVKEFATNFATNPLMKFVTVDESNNQIAINGGTPDDIVAIKKDVAYLDKPKPSIRVSAIAISTNLENQKGRDFSVKYDKLPPGQIQSNGVESYDFAGEVLGILTQTDRQFLAKLLWYQDRGRTETMTRPSSTTMSGVPVKVNMGITYYVASYNPVTGASSTASIPASITMDVLPIALPDGSIMATVMANIPDTSTSTGGTSNVPIVTVSNKQITTTMKLLNGQSMIMAGFLSTVKSKKRSYFPILGKLPFIGQLFSSSSIVDNNFELSIAFTFEIVENEAAAPSIKAIKKEVEKRAPVGTPGIEKTMLGINKEPTPKVSGTSVPETKQPILIGSKVVILKDGDSKGCYGIVKEIKSIEVVMFDGSKSTRPEFEVELDSGTMGSFTSEDLQIKVVELPADKPVTK